MKTTAYALAVLLLLIAPQAFAWQRLPAACLEPGAKPAVVETFESVFVAFPQGGAVEFGRLGDAITGLKQITVSEHILVDRTEVLPTEVRLAAFSEGKVPGVQNWKRYLADRHANSGMWPQRGGRRLEYSTLDRFRYTGYEIERCRVVLKMRLRESPEAGELWWLVEPVVMTIAGRPYNGVGWQIVLHGLEDIAWVEIDEPAVVRDGDWSFAQTWGKFIEAQPRVQSFEIEEGWYFGHMQPFFYLSGPHGTKLSLFDAPHGIMARTRQAPQRLINSYRIAFDRGEIRATPMKYWLHQPDALATKWQSLNQWTWIYDDLSHHYRQMERLPMTAPLPTLWWQFPPEEVWHRYRENGAPDKGESWLDVLADREIPQIAAAGFKVLYLEGVWENDAQHTPDGLLDRGQGFGSIDAPWDLTISEAVGGQTALKRFVARAHDLGLKVLLWATPGHFSNSSPILIKHPQWIKWHWDGIPETAAYGDVTGVDLNSGYFEYALSNFRHLKEKTNYDGIWQDSFLTFGLLADHREPQPTPQIDQLLEMHRRFRNMGLTDIHIEGCGPFGLSTGGYGYEVMVHDFSRADKKVVIERYEQLKGHEYGLYNYVADTFLEPESYFRALASKGIIGVYNMDMFRQLPKKEQRQIVRMNRNYLRVMKRMQKRYLLGQGDIWTGVLWKNDELVEEVLFNITDRYHNLARPANIMDLTSGEILKNRATWRAAPLHTYLIQYEKRQ